MANLFSLANSHFRQLGFIQDVKIIFIIHHSLATGGVHKAKRILDTLFADKSAAWQAFILTLKLKLK